MLCFDTLKRDSGFFLRVRLFYAVAQPMIPAPIITVPCEDSELITDNSEPTTQMSEGNSTKDGITTDSNGVDQTC